MKKDVAIIGMACIFPGAPDLAAYWRNILGGVDALSDPPPEYRADVYYDPASAENDRTYAKRGGYLKELTRFDPMKYGIMPRAVDGGDGEHFLALRVAYEALADAGYLEKPFDRTRTAIIIGRGTLSNRGYTTVIQHVVGVTQTLQILEKVVPGLGPEKLAEIRRELKAQLPPYSAETVPSVTSNILTGRIANRLDLMGPNYVVDAACASSIVALANAARELEEGNCDVACTRVSRPRSSRRSARSARSRAASACAPSTGTRTAPSSARVSASWRSSAWTTRCATATGSMPSSGASAWRATAGGRG